MAHANNHQLMPVSRLACGFCGFVLLHFNRDPSNEWAAYYRAVYTSGPLEAREPPRLSGVGFHRHDQEDNYVPTHAHELWEGNRGDGGGDSNAQQQQQQQQQYHQHAHPMSLKTALPAGPELVWIRNIRPPGPDVPERERADYTWGFLFHDACWAVLEQAAKPTAGSREGVGIGALWRVLCSVPCGQDLPNWGHNYGGLYTGTMRDQARGEHFTLLGRNSNLVIPSTFSNPFRVPELEALVQSMRIADQPAEERGAMNDSGTARRSIAPYGSSSSNSHSRSNNNHGSIPPGDGVSRLQTTAAAAAAIPTDPFSNLPLELKEMLMCYMDSPDAAHLRLASRALASTPLTQHFFQSRFWPGREMAVFFDAFLLSPAGRRGTDWQRLYWRLKIRRKYNRVCLGERNRLRLWTSTVRPLAEAVAQVRRMSTLMGGPDWRFVTDAAAAADVSSGLEADWKICGTAKLQSPLVFGEVRRVVHRAEVLLPVANLMSGLYVSFIDFFEMRYITGLRFVFKRGDDVELGYILRDAEEYLPVHDSLNGFHCATDECGFRALALISERNTITEYLSWAGRPEALTVFHLESAAKNGIERIRASFDGFRLQAILIQDR